MTPSEKRWPVIAALLQKETGFLIDPLAKAIRGINENCLAWGLPKDITNEQEGYLRVSLALDFCELSLKQDQTDVEEQRACLAR